MDFKSQQKKFDDIKWYDSIVAGEDRCGSYDFCKNCDKEEEFPCARAQERLYNAVENAKEEETYESEEIKTRIATIYLQIGE